MYLFLWVSEEVDKNKPVIHRCSFREYAQAYDELHIRNLFSNYTQIKKKKEGRDAAVQESFKAQNINFPNDATNQVKQKRIGSKIRVGLMSKFVQTETILWWTQCSRKELWSTTFTSPVYESTMNINSWLAKCSVRDKRKYRTNYTNSLAGLL